MSLFERLAALIPGQWEKVIVTALLVGMALLASHLWARYLSRGSISAEKRRLHLVWARNIIWFAALLVIVSVWASTIAGFALSVAAVAGALLIVSKELVMCVHGYLYVTLVQPFKIGDVIEFNHLHGRVVISTCLPRHWWSLTRPASVPEKWPNFPTGCCSPTR